MWSEQFHRRAGSRRIGRVARNVPPGWEAIDRRVAEPIGPVGGRHVAPAAHPVVEFAAGPLRRRPRSATGRRPDRLTVARLHACHGLEALRRPETAGRLGDGRRHAVRARRPLVADPEHALCRRKLGDNRGHAVRKRVRTGPKLIGRIAAWRIDSPARNSIHPWTGQGRRRAEPEAIEFRGRRTMPGEPGRAGEHRPAVVQLIAEVDLPVARGGRNQRGVRSRRPDARELRAGQAPRP